MTGILNEHIGAIVTWITIMMVVYIVAKYSFRELKEDGLGQGVYWFVISMFEVIVVVGIFLGLPYLIEKYIPVMELARWIRWIEILIVGHFYFRSRKHAESRGLASFYGHYALLLFAWFIDRWVGIMAIAMPLLLAYYYAMSRIALEIMPASNPDDKAEKTSRFWVFLSYTWGLQQALWKAPSTKATEAEKRIDGAPSILNAGGMIWTHSHQVIGIAEGPKFSMDGPGLIFIAKDRQPFDIVDLRDQSCSAPIKAISKDGISFEAKVTVTFRVDRDSWTKDQHQKLRRENPMLREGKELDRNPNGIFPYSYARVKSVLSYQSKKAMEDSEEIERWKEHVLNIAEEAAREVLAERSIEDLWKARENENSSAAEEITNEMKELINEILPKNGIYLIHAKAADFSFKVGSLKLDDEVSEQQLATWSVEWERQRAISLENGLAESERLQQEARAYAHSILLTAIAEGLQQARLIHPNLPRYVIAMRFIGALEEMLEKQPETNEKENQEARTNIRNIKSHFLSTPPGE